MKRTLITGTMTALSLAGVLALPAMAQTAPSSASPSPAAAGTRDRGRCPDGFDAGDGAGVRICRGLGGEWRLMTTDPAKSGAHEYTGVLTSDGAFGDVHLIRPESDDSASLDGEGRLNYDFKTFSGIDGVAFHPGDNATKVTFNLTVDGQAMAPAQIFIGDHGRHPKSDPFALRVRR